MALPFDATTKELLRYIRDWLDRLGVEVHGAVEEITPDLSTVTAAADKVFRIKEAGKTWLLHLDLQSSRDPSLSRRMLKYNSLLHERYGWTVHSIVVLLRREADDPGLTGVVQYQERPELGGMHFAFRVVRVWEWPVDGLLAGGLGTLPLAPLSEEVTEAGLAAIFRRMDERLSREVEPAEAAKLWTATYVLLGLRYSRDLVAQLFQGVRTMKDSVTYQAIIEEGEIKGEIKGKLKGVQRTLVLQGSKRFGPPDAATRAAIEAIDSFEQLERLSLRLLEAGSWAELLAPAAAE